MTASTTDSPTRADACVIACAEVFRGAGEVMASAFGTAPTLGARLARRTFEPDLVLESHMPYRRVFDVVWSGRRSLIMMASQIDRYGNQNISAIGDWRRPTAQLVGVRGAPGNTVNHPTSYWVPNHSPRSFVAAVDVVSGVGYDRAAAAGAAATRFHHIDCVISNLGVFDFDTPGHAMRVRSIHPGVTIDDIVAATGFDLVIPDVIEETRHPTDEEMAVIAELDPKGTRRREVPA